ncbi:cysteine peptidase family C39 domain-containing protein [Halonatronum saccharophilum]|uniref:cysteine peptidase family C39 domain-containing protein n=1 Tax=Halonatronum saccharophilum TaxID=150060 RepID=UPI0009FBEFBB|nr:cysteine peptidase family C39 domain-containing protein [Halonatronum saccharophilum]
MKKLIKKIKRKFKKYYAIKQHDITDCGPTSSAMIAKHYDLKIPIVKINEIARMGIFLNRQKNYKGVP